MRTFRLLLLPLLLVGGAAVAGPLAFDTGPSVPPVVANSKAALGCTVTWMIDDITNNDLFAVRMRIDKADGDAPINNRLPCPRSVSPRLADRALDVCRDREPDAKPCVFADMSRGFAHEPNVRYTAENTARCASDQASDIGVACWKSGSLSVCDVGCGNSPAAAVAAATARCQEKHERSCPITGSAPVSGP